jgi:hypothetical protein
LRVLVSVQWDPDAIASVRTSITTASNQYFTFWSQIDLVIGTWSLSYLRVLFCNKSVLQVNSTIIICPFKIPAVSAILIELLSNVTLQLLQHWTESLNNLVVFIHHDLWWILGQGSTISRNSHSQLMPQIC